MKFVISGYYGYGNAGDEAILQSIIQNLNLNFPKSTVTVFSNNPPATEKLHGVEALFPGVHHVIGYTNKVIQKGIINQSINIINEIKNTDCVIVGGGGIIHDWFGSFQIIKNLEKGILGKIMGKKTILYAVGAGPIKGWLSKCTTRFALSFFDSITVRDQESMDLLKSIGVKDDIIVTGDPAIILQKASESEINNTLDRKKIPDGKNIVICLRSWFHYKENKSNLNKNRKLFNDRIIELCNFISCKPNTNLILLAFQPSEDMVFYNNLIKQIKGDYILIDDIQKPGILKGIIASADVLIGMRLHSLIFAISDNVPVIAISYDSKIDSFLGTVSDDIVIHNVNEIDVESIKEELNSIISGTKEIDYRPTVKIITENSRKSQLVLKKLMKQD
ncbi:MAG: polysaccharide pyruvyl transferase family protein [Thermoplasmata archaeon]|nr:polysaccharide pyruvyl transferase family protein [Thermoplasmata archaeon]